MPSSEVKSVGARYGLRGVRVGEASLPGLPMQSSEFDMTLADSSDDGDLSFAHREVRATVKFIRDLALRVGPLTAGLILPRALRQQRWSPLNFPLMWTACSQESGVVVE